MKLIIDISKDRYDEIMAMDWVNGRLIFGEEIRAIHDGKVLEQGHFVDAVSRQAVLDINERHHGQMPNHVNHEIWKEIKALSSVTLQPKPNIKALGEDIRICQKSITDKKVLIGFNMAVALCNKHLAESEEKV